MELSRLSAQRVFSRNRKLIDRVLDQVEKKNENTVDLTGSTVDENVFDPQALKASSSRMMNAIGKEAMQYSGSHDYMPLKAEIAERYEGFGIHVQDKDFTITNGSTQAVDLICKVLVNDGDAILVDAPLHWRYLQAISMYRPEVLEVPVLSDGPDLEQLEKQLKAGKAHVYFSAPNGQDPTGVVWSIEKREKTASLMNEYGCILIELDRCGELIAPEKRPAYMKELLGDQCVLIGSFSPTLGPGLRIGWICATDEEIARYSTEAKQKTDSHANGYIQRVLWQYLKDYDYDRHVCQVRAAYEEKRTLVDALLEEYGVHRSVEQSAGNSIWLRLKKGKTGEEAFDAALQQGVLILPGEICSLSGSTENYIAVDYSGSDRSGMEKALEILKDLVRE